MKKFSGETTTIRIRKSIRDAARVIAKSEDRSLRSLVERLLTAAINAVTRKP